MSSPLRPSSERSKNGCYTCRVRKVKCSGSSLQHDGLSSGRPPCSNCSRLKFDCIWSRPKAGETFKPPPKRRKTLPKERQGESSDRGTSQDGPDPRSATTRTDVLAVPSEDMTGPGVNDWMDSLFGQDAAAFSNTSVPLEEAVNFLLPPSSFIPEESSSTWQWDALVQSATPNVPPQPTYTTIFDAPTSVLSPSADQATTRTLIQHYLEVMKGYAKIEERLDNLYISAFARALDLPALFHGILAYSASHLSLTQPQYVFASEYHAAEAKKGLEQESYDCAARLAAIFILVKRAHTLALPISEILGLLDVAGDTVALPENQSVLADPRGLARTVIDRLLLIDHRAAFFGKGGGKFAHRLRTLHPDFFDDLPGLQRASELRLRVTTSASPRLALSQAYGLLGDIETAILEVDRPDERHAPPLQGSVYNDYMISSVLHATVLYLDLLLQESGHFLPRSALERSTQRILHLALAVANDPSRRDTPSAIWCSSMFFAGLYVKDPIQRDWVCEKLQQGERWGLNIRKARELLEACVRKKDAGERMDIGQLMSSVTGDFVM